MSTRTMNGYKLIPTWLPVVITIVMIVASVGATSALYGSRLNDLERRADKLDVDRADKLKDYQQFKQDISVRMAEVQSDVKWIRQTLEARKP